MKSRYIFILIFFLLSCNTLKYSIRQDADIKILHLYVFYSEKIPEEVKEEFDNTLTKFIDDFNSDDYYEFKIKQTNDTSKENTFKILFTETNLVAKDKQIGYSFLSALGLYLPFFMIKNNFPVYIWFVIIPNDYTKINFKLSEDISAEDKLYIRAFSNPAMFINYSKQIKKHGNAYYDFLHREFNNFEKQYFKVLELNRNND